MVVVVLEVMTVMAAGRRQRTGEGCWVVRNGMVAEKGLEEEEI